MVGRTPQLRLRLPMPEAMVWVVFAVVEIGLLVLNWVTSNGGVDSTAPGWAFWVAIGLGGLLGAGGCVMFVQGERSLPQGSAPMLLPPTLPIGTISPDGTRWFDGTGWRDVAVEVPPGAPLSEDGGHWWDGQGWRPVPTAPNGGGRVRGRRSRSAAEPPEA